MPPKFSQISSKKAAVPSEVRRATAAQKKTPKGTTKAKKDKATTCSAGTSTNSDKKGGKRARSPSPTAASASECGPTTSQEQSLLDKQLVLSVILAKLEASKECDWHALSEKINAHAKPVAKASAGAKKGKSTKSNDESEGRLNGSELYELYHSKILPALKAGRALWIEDTQPEEKFNLPQTPVSVKDEASLSRLSSEKNNQQNREGSRYGPDQKVEIKLGEVEMGEMEEEGYKGDTTDKEADKFDSEEESQAIKKPRTVKTKPLSPSTPGTVTDSGDGSKTRTEETGHRGRKGVKTYQKKRQARASKADNAEDETGTESESPGDESLYTP
ncbi:hypothetical protein I317_07736 [Kwoniella heveanensis CBS 569]|nr:hypothetical protein I317_07736 [Kwoniella heveanensis CBS 569]